jgi:hypothetical protein
MQAKTVAVRVAGLNRAPGELVLDVNGDIEKVRGRVGTFCSVVFSLSSYR